MSKRIKVKGRIGVFYRIAKRIGGPGNERVYYVTYKVDGKKIEVKAGRQYKNNMTPAKAAQYRARLIDGLEQTPQAKRQAEKAMKKAEADRYTISKLWTTYKAAKPDLKGIKTDQNRFDLYIETAFGKREPSTLLPLDVDRLRLKLLKTKSPGTVKNVLELLRRIINFGVKKQLCEGISFTIEMPKVDNIKTEDISPEQLQALLEVIEKDHHREAGDMMLLALYSGMRRSEMFRLEWRDLDFRNGFITLRDTKGGADEKIPMNDAARQVLENHPKMKDSPFVFPGRGEKKRTDIKRPVNRIKKAAGIPDSFRALHGLRHVYATMLASSGQVDMYTLQKLMTHKSPLMTQRYAHLRDDALKKASQLAGDIVAEIAAEKDKKVVGLRKKAEK